MRELNRLFVTYSLFSLSLFAWCAGEAVAGTSSRALLPAVLLAGAAWGVWLCLPACVGHHEDTERLSRIVLGLAERVAAQSELLGRKAERDDCRHVCESCKVVMDPNRESLYLDDRDGEKWYCVECAMDHDWGDTPTAGSEVLE